MINTIKVNAWSRIFFAAVFLQIFFSLSVDFYISKIPLNIREYLKLTKAKAVTNARRHE